MLFVVMHKESWVQSVGDDCQVTSHEQEEQGAVSGCALPWVGSLARVSVVPQISAVAVFRQDPASLGVWEAFPRDIRGNGCQQRGGAASKLVLARTAQQTVHLQKTPTVMAVRFPPGRWEEAHFYPVSLAAA